MGRSPTLAPRSSDEPNNRFSRLSNFVSRFTDSNRTRTPSPIPQGAPPAEGTGLRSSSFKVSESARARSATPPAPDTAARPTSAPEPSASAPLAAPPVRLSSEPKMTSIPIPQQTRGPPPTVAPVNLPSQRSNSHHVAPVATPRTARPREISPTVRQNAAGTAAYGASPAVFGIRALEHDANRDVLLALLNTAEGKTLLNRGLIALIRSTPSATAEILRNCPPALRAEAAAPASLPSTPFPATNTFDGLDETCFIRIVGEYLGQASLHACTAVCRYWLRAMWSDQYFATHPLTITEHMNTLLRKNKTAQYGALTRICRAKSIALTMPQAPSFPLSFLHQGVTNLSVTRLNKALRDCLDGTRRDSLRELAVGCLGGDWRQFSSGWGGQFGDDGAEKISHATSGSLPNLFLRRGLSPSDYSPTTFLPSQMNNLRHLIIPFESILPPSTNSVESSNGAAMSSVMTPIPSVSLSRRSSTQTIGSPRQKLNETKHDQPPSSLPSQSSGAETQREGEKLRFLSLPSLKLLVVRECGTDFLRGCPNLETLIVRSNLVQQSGTSKERVPLLRLSNLSIKLIDASLEDMHIPNLKQLQGVDTLSLDVPLTPLRVLTHLDLKVDALKGLVLQPPLVQIETGQLISLNLRKAIASPVNEGDILSTLVQSRGTLNALRSLSVLWVKPGTALHKLVGLSCPGLQHLRVTRVLNDEKEIEELINSVAPAASPHPSLQTLHLAKVNWSPMKVYPRKTPLLHDSSGIQELVIDRLPHPLQLGPLLQRMPNLKRILIQTVGEAKGFDKVTQVLAAGAPLDFPSKTAGEWTYCGQTYMNMDYIRGYQALEPNDCDALSFYWWCKM